MSFFAWYPFLSLACLLYGLALSSHHVSILPPMADHRVPSQQANHISANTFPHPAFHPHGHVQRVAFLAVSLTIVVYPCVSFFRTLMWPMMTSKTSIRKVSLSP